MARRLAGRYGYPEYPNHFDVTLHPDRLEQPLWWKKPQAIFLCSMSDLFHEDVPFSFVDRVFDIMRLANQHIFMVLTKRPQRMLEYVHHDRERKGIQLIKPSHIWLGVTAENQKRADERIPILLQIPAAKRFVSLEPILGAIDLWRYIPYEVCVSCDEWWGHTKIDVCPLCESEGCIQTVWDDEEGGKLDWVIVGGESGPGARPMHPDWVRSVHDECVAAGVPWFFKQWGAWMPGETKAEVFGPTEIGERCIEHNGEWTRMYRVGKKAAGRRLDGQLWEQYPES